jgi:hypothetical protein
MYETSFSPASLPVFVVCFLDECQSDWGEMESFDLHSLRPIASCGKSQVGSRPGAAGKFIL